MSDRAQYVILMTVVFVFLIGFSAWWCYTLGGPDFLMVCLGGWGFLGAVCGLGYLVTQDTEK